jgi:hypothetical protein
MANDKPTNERLAVIETRLEQLEDEMIKERTDRKAMAATIFAKLDRAADRIGGLEKHLWFAIGALTVINIGVQWFLNR